MIQTDFGSIDLTCYVCLKCFLLCPVLFKNMIQTQYCVFSKCFHVYTQYCVFSKCFHVYFLPSIVVLVCEDKTKSCEKWVNKKKLCDENSKYKRQRFYVAMSRLCKKGCVMCGDDGTYHVTTHSEMVNTKQPRITAVCEMIMFITLIYS
jgi:hypothetical protein